MLIMFNFNYVGTVADKADEVQRGAEEGVGGGDAEDRDAEPAGRRQDGADAAGEGHARHTGRAPVVSREGRQMGLQNVT